MIYSQKNARCLVILVSNAMQGNDTQSSGGPVWDEVLPCAQQPYLQTETLIVTNLLSRLIGPHPEVCFLQ